MTHKNYPVQSQAQPLGGQGMHATIARLRGSARWLSLARAAWWVVALASTALTAAAVPISIANLRLVCPQVNCYYHLNAAQVQQLQSLGISLPLFAVGFTFIVTLAAAVYILVAFILYQHKRAGWVGLLGAFTLVTFGAVSLADAPILVSSAYPVLQLPINVLDYIGNVSLPLFIILFPDGRIKPRWTVGLAVAWAILRIPSVFFRGSFLNVDFAPIWIQIPVWIGFIGSLVLTQYYRYRRVYGPVLRQQTKWVVYGLMVSLGIFVAVPSLSTLLPAAVFEQSVISLFIEAAVYLVMILIPISFAIAMLRYRLWDIDLIINRTLVYVPLTAILAGLYSASISLFQKVFIATTGAKSDAALVISTFLLATTFTPIKGSLQSVVDKRFKESANPLKEIDGFRNQVQSVMDVLDTRLITCRLLNTAISALHATGGAIYLDRSAQRELVQATPGWQEEQSVIRLPLEWGGKQVGLLSLGRREAGVEYTAQERQAIQQAASQVAQVLAGKDKERL